MRDVTTVSDDARFMQMESDINGDGLADMRRTEELLDNGDWATLTRQLNEGGTALSSVRTTTSGDGLSRVEEIDRDGNGTFDLRMNAATTLASDGSRTTVSNTYGENAGTLLMSESVQTSDDGLQIITARDFDGDGQTDRETTWTRDIRNSGAIQTIERTQAFDGSTVVYSTHSISGDGREIRKTDNFGDARVERVEELLDDGSLRIDINFQEVDYDLLFMLARDRTIQSADGLSSTRTVDFGPWDGIVDLTSTELITIADDGSTTRTVSHADGVGAIANEAYFVSDDGLTQTMDYDYDGDAAFEFQTTATTTYAANGDISTTTSTVDQAGSAMGASFSVVGGNGLDATTTVNFDGIGGSDMVETRSEFADGRMERTTQLFGDAGALAYQSTQNVSSDRQQIVIATDHDGDGVDDHVITSIEDDSRNLRTSLTETRGSLSKIDLFQAHNNTQSRVSYDINGDQNAEFVRNATRSFDQDGNEVVTTTELFGANVTFRSTSTLAYNGASQVTTRDTDGDGTVDETTTMSVDHQTDGTVVTDTTTTSSHLPGNGTIGRTVITTSADGRSVTTQKDFDGNGNWDQVILRETKSDGSLVTTRTAYDTAGTELGTATVTTSLDGRLTTTQNPENTETLEYSAIGNGSYVWDGGTYELQGQVGVYDVDESSSWQIDGSGVGTWHWEAVTSSPSLVQPFVDEVTVRLDEATRNRFIEEAERIVEAVNDRAMLLSEREMIAAHIETQGNGSDSAVRFDAVGYAKTMLQRSDFPFYFSDNRDTELIVQVFTNALGRMPSLEEFDRYLIMAGETGGVIVTEVIPDAKGIFVVEVANSVEMQVAKGEYLERNNFDVELASFDELQYFDDSFIRENVINSFRGVYGREATSTEVQSLLNQLMGSANAPIDVAQAVLDLNLNTPDSVIGLYGDALVQKLFLNSLDRAPTAEDLATWSGRVIDSLVSKLSVAEFVSVVSGTPEALAVNRGLINAQPTLTDDGFATDEGVAAVFDALSNDADPDGDILSITHVDGQAISPGAPITTASGATVELLQSGLLRYDPASNFNGTDILSYAVSDGNGGSDTGTMTITVAGVNDAPIASDDSATLTQDTEIVVDVLANDNDADGDALSLASVGTPANGTAVIEFNQLRYTPNPGFSGTDSVSYTVNDGNGGTDTATVTFTVEPTGPAPSLVGESGSVTVAQSGPDQWHSVTFTDAIANAVVVLGPLTTNDTEQTTTRVRNVTDTGFEFQIDEWDYLDGVHGAETLGWLAVSEGTHVLQSGQTVVAGSASVGTGFSTQSFGASLVNPVVFAEASTVNEASAITTRIRSVTSDSFQVQIEEEEAGGTHAAETVGWIAIEAGTGSGIEAVRTADQLDEVVDTFTFNTDFGETPVLLADMQSTDGGDTTTTRMAALDASSVSLFGEEEQSANSELGHTNETAGYLALEAGQLFAPDSGGNSAPTATNDSATLGEDGTILVDVLANDSDVDGDALTVSFVSGAANGTVGIESNQIRYDPDPDFYGTETLSYTVTDGSGGSDTGTLTLTITPENDAPVAANDTVSVAEGAALTLSPLGNDSDIEGDPLTISEINGQAVSVGSVVTLASVASVELLAGEQLSFAQNGTYDSLNTGQSAVESFEYRISDGQGGSDVATIDVTVNGQGGAASLIGEAGSLTVSQSGPDQWHSVSFGATIANAVVVLGPLSNNDTDPATMRVRNVTDTGFEFQIDEYDYQDGIHGSETVSWLAMSEGSHTLANGATLVAGTASAGTGYQAVSFGETLTNAVVLHEVTSVNDPDAVVSRVRNVDGTGFDVRIREQEAGTSHVAEEISWIAIEAGSGAGIDAGRSGDAVNQSPDAFTFTESFANAPVLLGDMQTRDGGDTSTMRLSAASATGFSAFVAEEQSNDTELNHTNEVIGWLALNDGFLF